MTSLVKKHQWTAIPSAPYYNTTVIPSSGPPVTIGGCDVQGVPTADVAMLKESWSKVASLSSPRLGVAVVPINCESLKVLRVVRHMKNVMHIASLQ